MASETTPLVGNGSSGGSGGSVPGNTHAAPQRTYTNGDREVEVWKPGKSGFWATLLNTLGDLIGTGLLATPIAIAHAGWVCGPLALVLVCGVTLWT